MFWNKEKQSLLKARTKSLRKAEQKVDELNSENKAVHEENKELRFENEELKDTLKEIYKLTICNKYNNEKSIFNKIKELVDDHQSIN